MGDEGIGCEGILDRALTNLGIAQFCGTYFDATKVFKKTSVIGFDVTFEVLTVRDCLSFPLHLFFACPF